MTHCAASVCVLLVCVFLVCVYVYKYLSDLGSLQKNCHVLRTNRTCIMQCLKPMRRFPAFSLEIFQMAHGLSQSKHVV